MVYGIYAIYDVAMKCYAQPFYQTNDDVAKRSFRMAINDPRAESLYPVRDDLELWCIGQFDDKSGNIIFKQKNEETKFFSTTYPCRILSRGEAVIKEKEEKSNDEV